MRQIVLDTETTGLETTAGHRIIEVGCVEVVNRRLTGTTFHRYVNPERAIEEGAKSVHGIDDAFLADKPIFAAIAEEFVEFVRGAELVIHNADFDIGFINYELAKLDLALKDITKICGVHDTLKQARETHPGQRNNLDALAKRYEVDISKRELHGALLDAEILAQVYLTMTGGQVSLSLESDLVGTVADAVQSARVRRDGLVLIVREASTAERARHEAALARIREQCSGALLWDTVEFAPAERSG